MSEHTYSVSGMTCQHCVRAVTQAIQQGQSSTTALKGSTEEEQFQSEKAA